MQAKSLRARAAQEGPVCTLPHLQEVTVGRTVGVFAAPSTGAVLRKGARKAVLPSPHHPDF